MKNPQQLTRLEFTDAIINLISHKKRWCKGTVARDKDDHYIDPNSESAVKWCLAGAMVKIAGSGTLTHNIRACQDIRRLLPDGVGSFNDTSTHKQVMQFLTTYRTSLIT